LIPYIFPVALLAALTLVPFSTTAQATGGAWLGVWIDDTPTDHAPDAYGFRKSIVNITVVAQGGPAEAAGLLPNDVILEINGRAVHSVRDAVCLLRAARPGQILPLATMRQSETRIVFATVAEWPEGTRPPDLDCPPPEISNK
jgi:S1-C subfamily serine protease